MSTTRFSTLGLALETFDRVILGKALPSILTQDGFIREVLREANLLRRGVRKSVDEVMAQVRRSTNINWRGATAAQQAAVVLQLGNLLKGLPSDFLPAVKIVLDERGQIVFRKTKSAIKKRHKSLDIDPTLRLVDQEGVDALKNTTSLFFSPEYERQADRFTVRAQKQITDGLEKGLGRAEIASELSREFRETAINQAYWETTAAVHVNRARSFSSALSYAQAGVTEYEVIAVMDERTTEMCVFLNGTILTIESAIKSFDAFEAAETLEEVKEEVMPFLRVRGEEIVLPSGQRVATIDSPREFSNGMNAKQLNGAGVNMPPYHYRCRTTVAPVL